MFSTLLFWGGIAVVLLIVTLGALGWIITLRDNRRLYHRPIICVCEINGRIGVVLRCDYDKTSRRYWKPYFSEKGYYDAGHVVAPSGRRLEVLPVFVFKAGSKEYYTLVCSCYVECATFDVPFVSENKLDPIAEAYRYFHGKFWNGQLINW